MADRGLNGSDSERADLLLLLWQAPQDARLALERIVRNEKADPRDVQVAQ
jgi:hypothetical protein